MCIPVGENRNNKILFNLDGNVIECEDGVKFFWE